MADFFSALYAFSAEDSAFLRVASSIFLFFFFFKASVYARRAFLSAALYVVVAFFIAATCFFSSIFIAWALSTVVGATGSISAYTIIGVRVISNAKTIPIRIFDLYVIYVDNY